MSVSQSSTFIRPLANYPKLGGLSNISSSYFRRKSFKATRISSSMNGHTNIPCRKLLHPLESEIVTMDDYEYDEGIGIDKFYQGKNIFITGGTGLVGKAFIEKMLRSTEVGKIYVLIKAADKEAALDRLNSELVDSELFKSLEEQHGSSYQEFVRDKLVPIVGNICEPNLGMDSESTRTIMDQVDIIVNSAASTTLNDRYDVLIDVNVHSARRLMRFAKTCKNLKLFTHFSTVYVNGIREGTIYEEPMYMGENRRKEVDEDEISISLFPRLDLTDEISLASRICKASTSMDVNKDLKKLGQERATFYGWYNAYHMTKAMAEMALNEMRGDVPLLIIRPSVIESTYKNPVPGWIQGNRCFDPVIIAYGKGQLPGYLCDAQVHMDMVPLDMVVDTTIAAIAKHGITMDPPINVYHVGTEFTNPLPFFEFFEYLQEYFSSRPFLSNSKTINKMELFNEFADFSKYTRDEISSQSTNGSVKSKYKAKIAYAERLCKMYEFVGFINARFHTGYTRRLLDEMSNEEKLKFEVDTTKIDWKQYVFNHIDGLRKHVLQETCQDATAQKFI